MTRALMIAVPVCLLVVGAAAIGMSGRPEISSPPELFSRPAQNPVANREGKTDKLVVAAAPPLVESGQAAAAENEPPGPAADTEASGPAVLPPTVSGQFTPQKPKLAARPAPQKSYALLSDAQIAGIKDRLRLSSSQESYWPAVEDALRAVARKIHETRQAHPRATNAPIDPDCAEVQQLKSAAMPLLFQLREDQKREVRTLARLIGLERVASQI